MARTLPPRVPRERVPSASICARDTLRACHVAARKNVAAGLRASSEETFSEAEASGLDSLGFLETPRGQVRPRTEPPPRREGSGRLDRSNWKRGASRGSRSMTTASAMVAARSHRPRAARRTSLRGQGRAVGLRGRSVRKPRPLRPGPRRFQTRASRARRGQARCVEGRIVPSAVRHRMGNCFRRIECVARTLRKESGPWHECARERGTRQWSSCPKASPSVGGRVTRERWRAPRGAASTDIQDPR